VLEFKAATLQQHGARPTSNQVNVPIDLRQDWPKALQEAGFDASQPCAWSAEGLLLYLPASAQDRLFERVHALSPRGCWLAANAPGKGYPDRLTRQREQMQRLRDVAAKRLGIEITDFVDLWYAEERTDLADWLREHGWDASVATIEELLTRYGRRVPDEDVISPTVFISAQRPAD
jgi:methyltransferase (TIGR00027 family)